MRLKVTISYPGHYMAYDDNTYDGPGSLYGVGETPRAAIEEFLDQLEEKYA